MADVRKIFIQNENGERINCLLRSSFYNDINGYGYGNEYYFVQPRDGFYTVAEQTSVQQELTGRLSFLNRRTAYEDYRTFTSWINRAEELTIVYIPYGVDEFYIDVAISSVTKGEMDIGGFLSCDISFLALTPWYSPNNLELSFDDTIIQGIKRYNYQYDYKYGNTTTPGSIDISVGGDYDAAIYFMSQGPVEDPVLSLYDRDSGELLGQLDLTGLTIQQEQQLIFRTTKKDTGVFIKTGTEYTDIIDSVILTPGIDVFFLAPRNRNLTITYVADGTLQTTTQLILYEYYKTR